MAEQKRTAGPLRLEAEELEAWRTQRTTIKVRRYLADLASHVREQWARGEAWSDEMRRYVTDLDDFEDIDFEAIEQFYAGEESDEQA